MNGTHLKKMPFILCARRAERKNILGFYLGWKGMKSSCSSVICERRLIGFLNEKGTTRLLAGLGILSFRFVDPNRSLSGEAISGTGLLSGASWSSTFDPYPSDLAPWVCRSR